MTAEAYPASCRHFYIKQSDTACRARMAVQGRCTIFGFPITGFLHFFVILQCRSQRAVSK